MTSVRLENIEKRFGSTIALRDINLHINAGEIYFLLGPSGCGKTTLLRLIAGLHAPSSGRIFFGERDVTGLGTERRNAVMCFQSYALWPHLSVKENVRFGLRVRGLSPAQQEQRIVEVLNLVQLSAYADRKPNALSGGQQQRAALARALAVSPDCLLLDEPLSNLDAKLRLEMRSEIRRICKAAGTTTIYVTHDQKEALSIADRVALMKDGRVVQVGTPADLYYRPATSFAADFIGQTNLLLAEVVDRDERSVQLRTALGVVRTAADGIVASTALLSIRPEQLRIGALDAPADPGAHRAEGKLIESTFLGEATEHVVAVGGQRVKALSATPLNAAQGSDVFVEFRPQDAVVLAE